MIFNLSTLELDNGSQLLFFAGSWIVNSAKEKHELATTKQNWLQFGYKFEICEKEKSRKSLTYRTLSNALQDELEPEYMKPTEIIRNCKKLNTNKLHKRIER